MADKVRSKAAPAGSHRREPGTQEASPGQRVAGMAAAAALVVAALWTLREFMPALLWAVVIAIGVWPLFEQGARRWPRARRTLAPALVVLALLVAIVGPLSLAAVPLAQDAHGAAAFIAHARTDGLAPPPILGQLPFGDRLTPLWREHIGQPGQLDEFSSQLAQGKLVDFGRHMAQQAAHRAMLLGFTLLALFLLLQQADGVIGQARVASRRFFGPAGERVGEQMVLAVRGAVNGLVLVGLAEGAVMTAVYLFTGAPHGALLGLFTALLAMVPFGATAAFLVVSVILLALNKIVGAVVVAVVGFVVTFVADHFFRPVLIGGATQLPFLWVLLGILGGVTAFGLLGLFVGPAILAAVMLLWREWVGALSGPLNPEDEDAAAAEG